MLVLPNICCLSSDVCILHLMFPRESECVRYELGQLPTYLLVFCWDQAVRPVAKLSPDCTTARCCTHLFSCEQRGTSSLFFFFFFFLLFGEEQKMKEQRRIKVNISMVSKTCGQTTCPHFPTLHTSSLQKGAPVKSQQLSLLIRDPLFFAPSAFPSIS